MKILNFEQEKRIISYIKENFKIPTSGFIAGQAVASLIYKELNLNINAPINDIDVFEVYDRNRDGAFVFQMNKNTTNVISTNIKEGSAHSLSYFQNFRKGYRVVHSKYLEEDNNVNIILIDQVSKNEENPCVDGEMLINSFDFNCCSVGFNIDTEEFIYTNAFKDFLKSKQLRVQSAHTPYHSWLRLNKKIKDLGEGVFCNVVLERFVLLKSMNYSDKDTFVGERFLEMKKEYGDELFNRLVFFIELKNNKTIELKKEYFKIELNNEFLSSPEMQEYSLAKNEGMDDLINLFEMREQTKVSELLDSVNLVSAVHACYNTGLYKQKYLKKLRDFASEFNSDRFSMSVLLEKMTSNPLLPIKGDLPIRKIKRIEKTLSLHPRLINFITYRKDSLISIEEKLDLIEKIYLEVNKNKQKVCLFGLMETNLVSFEVLNKNYKKPIDEIMNLVIKDIKDAESNIKNKKIWKNNTFKLPFIKVKQMMDIQDFYFEGVDMNNCIFGHYPSFLLSDSNYYFSLDVFNKRSSLHIDNRSIMKTDVKEILEHRSYSNGQTDIFSKIIANIVLSKVQSGKINFSFIFGRIYRDCKEKMRFKINQKMYKSKKIYKLKKFLKSKNLLRSDKPSSFLFDDDIPF